MENDILGGFIAAFGADNEPAGDDNNFDAYDFSNIDPNASEKDANRIDPKEMAKRFGAPSADDEPAEEEQDDQDDDDDELEDPVDNSDDDLDDDSDDEPVVTKPKDKTKKTDKKPAKESDLFEDESEVAGAIYGMFVDKLGIDDEDMPTSIDGIIERLYDIVEENSVPVYASEEVSKLDKFVKDGGKLEDYFKAISDYEATDEDLKSEDGQKRIIKKFLEHQGYSKEQINKKIDRYDIAGVLEDEAEDAIEKLNTIKANEQEKLLSSQAKAKEAFDKKQQDIYENVVTTIKGLDEINGVSISSKDKKELVKYLFEPTTSGLTKWQEDGKDIKNIVTAAFIMKSGPTLIDAAKRKGKSEAYTKIKKGLRDQSVARSRSEKFGRNVDVSEELSNAAYKVSKLFGGPSSRN